MVAGNAGRAGCLSLVSGSLTQIVTAQHVTPGNTSQCERKNPPRPQRRYGEREWTFARHCTNRRTRRERLSTNTLVPTNRVITVTWMPVVATGPGVRMRAPAAR